MDLASLIVGSIALVLAVVTLPTAFQMWWGRPKISIGFDHSLERGRRVLLCHITNKIVENRLLQILGVRREAVTVKVFYDIKEYGTNKLIIINNPFRMWIHKGDGSYQITLDTAFPAAGNVIEHVENGAVYFDGHHNETKLLPIGEYEVSISAVYGHYNAQKRMRLHIDVNSELSNWEPLSP